MLSLLWWLRIGRLAWKIQNVSNGAWRKGRAPFSGNAGLEQVALRVWWKSRGRITNITIRELTLLWYSCIYFCKVCIWPKKSKNDSWHWIEIYRRIVIVESSINRSLQKDCQVLYYWLFMTILHQKSNHQLCVKDFTEEGLDGTLHHLKKCGELR